MQLIQNEEVVVIDVRSNLMDPDKGLKQYKHSHIPGAYYLHLTNDLSGEVKEHGGNHPLPDVEPFTKKLTDFGITENTYVVVYDEKNDMFAPRAWWLLQYVGVQNVFVLN